ncbi:MAG TPA: hypothetical protein VJJ76_02200 [archaeon]|nr:hypothetical protein [archaeon]
MQQTKMNGTKMKYAWDITAEKEFSEKELTTINQISEMLSGGGNIAELKKKMKFIAMV